MNCLSNRNIGLEWWSGGRKGAELEDSESSDVSQTFFQLSFDEQKLGFLPIYQCRSSNSDKKIPLLEQQSVVFGP